MTAREFNNRYSVFTWWVKCDLGLLMGTRQKNPKRITKAINDMQYARQILF